MLYFTLYSRENSNYKPPGAYIRRGNLMEGFLRYDFGELILGGAYFQNFMVCCEKLGTSHDVKCFAIGSFLERIVVERAKDDLC